MNMGHINIVLASFNLIPIPPLDGSKILMGFSTRRFQYTLQQIEPYGMFILVGLLLIGALNRPIVIIQRILESIIGSLSLDKHFVCLLLLPSQSLMHILVLTLRHVSLNICQSIAGWSSQVARRAHNPKVTGSNPVPATKNNRGICFKA